MGIVFGSNTRVLVDATELTSFLNEVDYGGETAMEDVTPFGASGQAKVYFPGLAGSAVTMKGFYDPRTTAQGGSLDPELFGDLGSAAFAVSVGNQGFALGSLVSTYGALEASFKITSVTDKVDKLAVSFTASGPVNVRGFSLLDGIDGAPIIATGNASSLNNGASSTNGGVATLHVLAVSGTSPSATFSVQHSSDNVTFVTLATFTAVTAPGSQRLIVANGTTVNQYLRASYTVTGTTPSFSAQISFARM